MKNIQAICVFCASSEAVGEVYKAAATELGWRMGRSGVELIYGGASIGLMGCVARGVHAEGGQVTGVLPEFFHKKDIGYLDADELIVTQDMRERKAVLDARADGFIVLPGGVGTLEEAMEILSMRQLKLTDKPLVFVNIEGFYDGWMAHLRRTVALGFAKESIFDLFEVVAGPGEALDYILGHQPP